MALIMEYFDYTKIIESIYFSQPVWLYIFTLISLIILGLRNITFKSLLHNLNFKYTYYHPQYTLLNNLIDSQTTPLSRVNLFLKKILYLVLLGLLFLSLAEPYQLGGEIPDPPNNRDIVFLVDNEVSMVLRDYFIDDKRVDRLTMVKSVLLNFSNKLSGNRISLITYSEEAHTLLPFTTDTKLITAMIPRIESTLTGRTSDPQKALLYTLNYLHNIKIDNDRSAPSIILITDVLRPPRDIDPNVIAKYIKEKEYKLYVVAIGSNNYNDADINNSTLIYHPTSFKRLKEIAKTANGEFYWAKSTASLTGVIQGILKSKKTKIKIEPEYIEIPLFQWPLALFLILISLKYLSYFFYYRNTHV